MNTGLNQATVAYKVTPEGQPLDVDGNLTSASGKRQAIAVMEGTPNPNPAAYDVQYTFTRGGFIQGVPTSIIDLEKCPASVFRIDVTNIVLHPGNVDDVINIFSTFGWVYLSDANFVTVSPTSGAAGTTTPVTVSRTATLGQGVIEFKDIKTNEIKQVNVVNTDGLGWILETGIWNSLRFWDAAGIWNY